LWSLDILEIFLVVFYNPKFNNELLLFDYKLNFYFSFSSNKLVAGFIKMCATESNKLSKLNYQATEYSNNLKNSKNIKKNNGIFAF
jgi:hypothetical protein